MIGHDDESLGTKAQGTWWRPGRSPNRRAAVLDPPRPGGWRRRHTAWLIFIVLVLAVIVSSLISIPYYAVTPGTAQSVERLIALPSADRHEHKGSFLLVDVELIALRAIEWPYYKLDPNVDIVPSGSLLGPETAAQYNTEGVIDMAMAEQAAKVVALRETGHLVSVRPAGALIYAVEQGTPAAQDLQVGEVVTALDGKAVTDAPGLGRLISVHRPGDVVTV
ncbi:MAG: PDZ domain-containing protein, partial [Acidimicrobiales bacterium]